MEKQFNAYGREVIGLTFEQLVNGQNERGLPVELMFDSNVEISFTKEIARRLIELAYLHAWGPVGTPELRAEFNRMWIPMISLGNFTSKDGKFIWFS